MSISHEFEGRHISFVLPVTLSLSARHVFCEGGQSTATPHFVNTLGDFF